MARYATATPTSEASRTREGLRSRALLLKTVPGLKRAWVTVAKMLVDEGNAIEAVAGAVLLAMKGEAAPAEVQEVMVRLCLLKTRRRTWRVGARAYEEPGGEWVLRLERWFPVLMRSLGLCGLGTAERKDLAVQVASNLSEGQTHILQAARRSLLGSAGFQAGEVAALNPFPGERSHLV